MRNTLKTLLLIVLFISTQASTVLPEESSVIGKWTGTAGSKNDNNGTYFAFVLNADQSIHLLSADKKNKIVARGSYTYSNSALKASYTFKDGSSFHLSGTLDSETKKFSGNWHGGREYDSFTGKWIAKKNNL